MADIQTQSSFIPKKPARGGSFSGRSGSLFTFIANLIFVIVLIAAVAVFIYSKFLNSQISKMENNLTSARSALEPDVIKELSNADKRLTSAQMLINNHITLSSFFELLQTLTLKDVRFTSFSWSVDGNNSMTVTLKGEAKTYALVALQSKVFSDNANFLDPKFSDLDLSDKGTVIFSMKTGISPKLVSYVEKFNSSPAPATPVVPKTPEAPTNTASTTADSSNSTPNTQ